MTCAPRKVPNVGVVDDGCWWRWDETITPSIWRARWLNKEFSCSVTANQQNCVFTRGSFWTCRSEWTSYLSCPVYANAHLVWKKNLYCDICSKQICKQDSVRIPTKSRHILKSSCLFYTTTTKTNKYLPWHCLHPVPIFNLWCCAWEKTFASQRGKTSRRDGQIPCIEGRTVSDSRAHRRIWRRWKNWEENWSKDIFVEQDIISLQGLYQSKLYQLWFPNFKSWFCLRGRDHPIFQKLTAL